MRILMIAALAALPLPALAADVVGNWACTAQKGETSVTNALNLRKNGKYTSDINITGTSQGAAIDFSGSLKGRYTLDGNILTTTPTKVKPTSAKVNGTDLMQDKTLKATIEQQLSAQMSAMQGQLSITELTDATMVFGSGDGATRCTQR